MCASPTIRVAFGISALIAGAGILGLVAMTTSRRTREIGIRLALGATRRRVVGQFVGEQMTAVTLGLVAGGAVAAWLVRFVSVHLYKITVYDARAWTTAVAALLIVTAIGASLPSWRASRIDPVRALRVE